MSPSDYTGKNLKPWPVLLDHYTYSIWYVIKILSPLFLVLKHCQHEVHLLEMKKKIKLPIVPHMDEFFRFLYIDRQRCLRQKTWKI